MKIRLRENLQAKYFTGKNIPIYGMLGVITPCTCTRGKVIVFVRLSLSVVTTKIARSQALGICVCCNYHKLVDIVKKLVSCVSNY